MTTNFASSAARTGRCSILRCQRSGPTSRRPPITSCLPAREGYSSFVVHHAPKVPGRRVPFVIALPSNSGGGVRMLGELRNVDPAAVAIGMPVEATFIDFPAGEAGPEWTLYAWELAVGGGTA